MASLKQTIQIPTIRWSQKNPQNRILEPLYVRMNLTLRLFRINGLNPLISCYLFYAVFYCKRSFLQAKELFVNKVLTNCSWPCYASMGGEGGEGGSGGDASLAFPPNPPPPPPHP
ncbi:hypothetical protein ES705_24804 [subsurface metagenome]